MFWVIIGSQYLTTEILLNPMRGGARRVITSHITTKDRRDEKEEITMYFKDIKDGELTRWEKSPAKMKAVKLTSDTDSAEDDYLDVRMYRHKNMERANYDSMESQQQMSMFTPMLLVSQFLGIIAIVSVAVWTGHFLGGFGWTNDASDKDGISKMFNYHPLFMVIGFIVLYGNSILLYRVFRRESKRVTKVIHGLLQLVVFVLVIVALTAVFNSHNLKGEAHLYTLHALLGITTVVLHGCQLLAGFTAFLFPGAATALRTRYMPYIVTSGWPSTCRLLLALSWAFVRNLSGDSLQPWRPAAQCQCWHSSWDWCSSCWGEWSPSWPSTLTIAECRYLRRR